MSYPQAKKPKMMSGAGKNKNYYVHKSQKKLYMEPGQRGFLATCNFREKDAIREAYNILNSYADDFGSSDDKNAEKEEVVADEEDISDALDKAISENKEQKKLKAFRFQAVDSGAANCLFIKTTLPNICELGLKVVKDIAKTKQQRTRHLLRLVPIEAVCKANLKDILEAAGPLFDIHFLKEPKTFSIIYNKRYNNCISRDEIIKELADLVSLKNIHNKVNLKHPDVSVIVEIIRGLCCLSVVAEYVQLKKYNLIEVANAKDEVDDVAKDNDEKENEVDDVPKDNDEKENEVDDVPKDNVEKENEQEDKDDVLMDENVTPSDVDVQALAPEEIKEPIDEGTA